MGKYISELWVDKMLPTEHCFLIFETYLGAMIVIEDIWRYTNLPQAAHFKEDYSLYKDSNITKVIANTKYYSWIKLLFAILL